MRNRFRKAVHTGAIVTIWSSISAAVLLHVLYYNILFSEKS